MRYVNIPCALPRSGGLSPRTWWDAVTWCSCCVIWTGRDYRDDLMWLCVLYAVLWSIAVLWSRCCKTSKYHRTFILLSVSLWNNLGEPVFDGVGLADFKGSVEAFLLALPLSLFLSTTVFPFSPFILWVDNFFLIRWFLTATSRTKPIIVAAWHIYILLHQREKWGSTIQYG